MAKTPSRQAGRTKKPQPQPQRATDDGTPLAPVDGSTVIGDLKIEEIVPPPFPTSRSRLSNKTPSRKSETTSMPDDTSEPPPAGKRKADKQAAEPAGRKGDDSGTRQERAVFGIENRVLYTPTNVFPNRAVCKLIVTYPWTPAGKAWGGTGNLIGSRHVLTAGHVLHKAAEGGWAKTIRVIPGMDGNTWWYGSELLTWPNFKQRSVSGWSEDQDIDYDYGLITLNTGFPALGTFGLLYLSGDDLDSTTAYILGYPGDKGNPMGRQQYGVPGGGGITDYDSTLVYYAIDTSGGQSGAGVFRFWNGVRAIFGVHGGQYDSDENRAARITKARHDQIRGWQAQD